MVLLYLRLPDRPLTVPVSEKAKNTEGKSQPSWWVRWFRFSGGNPKESRCDRKFQKLNTTYYLERRFLL